MGFRSVLRVPIRLDGRFAAGLAFHGPCARVYEPSDVQAARRIAQRSRLCLSGERGVEASKRADEAAARAHTSSRACGAVRRARRAHGVPPRDR